MQIHIIAVGKIRERYLTDGIAEYVKRLKPYARLSIIEVPHVPRPDVVPPAQEERILEKEAEAINRVVPEGSYLIALEIQGKKLSSEGLAEIIRNREVEGRGGIVFIIGGDLGLSPVLLERCDLRFSLSAMTFPHTMVRLILLEQVYRAFRINRNEPYHR